MKLEKHRSSKVKTIIVFPFKRHLVNFAPAWEKKKKGSRKKTTQMVTEKPSSVSPLFCAAAEAGPPAYRADASTYLRCNWRSTLPIYLPFH